MPSADFCNRPKRVFSYERFGVGGGGFESGKVGWRTGIAEGDADIAQEGRSLDPLDRAFGEQCAKRRAIK